MMSSAVMRGYRFFNIRILSVSVKNYPYPYTFKQGNYYPYPIRIRENCGYPQKNYTLIKFISAHLW